MDTVTNDELISVRADVKVIIGSDVKLNIEAEEMLIFETLVVVTFCRMVIAEAVTFGEVIIDGIELIAFGGVVIKNVELAILRLILGVLGGGAEEDLVTRVFAAVD